MKNGLLILLLGLFFWACTVQPENFASIKTSIPSIEIEARYATDLNFLGRPVNGYTSSELVLTKEALEALKLVQYDLQPRGLGLLIFDGYRPQRAVDDFVAWAKDLNDTVNKTLYYPDVPKDQLFERGYIAAKSGHSRGSTVDLTLIDLESRMELDMGSTWDFFGIQSHVNYLELNAEQLANRKLLQDEMIKHGFVPLPEEWWHFTLKDEPYPETYFDFPIN